MTSRAGRWFLPIFLMNIRLPAHRKAERKANCASADYNTKSQAGRFPYLRLLSSQTNHHHSQCDVHQRLLLGWPKRPPWALCWTQQNVCHCKDKTYSINNSHKTLWEEVPMSTEGDLNNYVPPSSCQAHHPGGSSSYSRLQMESFMGIQGKAVGTEISHRKQNPVQFHHPSVTKLS